jgi:hypothetical protein
MQSRKTPEHLLKNLRAKYAKNPKRFILRSEQQRQKRGDAINARRRGRPEKDASAKLLRDGPSL